MYYGKGTDGFAEIIDAQIALWSTHRMAKRREPPMKDTLESLLSSREWHIVQPRYRVDDTPKYETLFALANGAMGTRGAYEEPVPGGYPATYVAGVFDRTVTYPKELVNAPNWLELTVRVHGELVSPQTGTLLSCERRLDMRSGLLFRRMRWRDAAGRVTRLETLRLVHLRSKHQALITGVLVPENHDAEVEICAAIDGTVSNPTPSRIVRTHHNLPRRAEAVPSGGIYLEVETLYTRIVLGVASHLVVEGADEPHVDVLPNKVAERRVARVGQGQVLRFTKFVSIHTSRDTTVVRRAAVAELLRMEHDGADALVESQRAAWHAAWEDADITIAGDAEAQRAVRFNVFHLLSLSSEHDGDVSVGAKGLHGEGYKGSVFWDTEIFMLPFYIYTRPRAARALVEYRARRLDAARDNARTNGYRGAQYPWESGSTGHEATPERWADPITMTGPPIRTGELQHHVTADVAYSFDHYLRATGDGRFFVERAAEVFVETARFWASRVRLHPRRKRYVIENVIGPDEAHEEVDNNRSTNRLAAWNLTRAVEAVAEMRARHPAAWRRLNARLRVTENEPAAWRRIAERMWYPRVSASGVLEQHDGYFDLKPVRLKLNDKDMPIVSRELLERQGATQLLKQADVVLLQFLFSDEFDARSKRTNYAYYAPRTSHLSSLSPSTYAVMGAEVGDTAEAWRNFRRTAFMDL
jgi:kojibiose phosphorylase